MKKNEKNVKVYNQVKDEQKEAVKFSNPFGKFNAEQQEFMFKVLSNKLKNEPGDEPLNKKICKFYEEKFGAKWMRSEQEWEERGRAVKKGEEPFYLWDKKDVNPVYVPKKVYSFYQTYDKAWAEARRAEEMNEYRNAFGWMRDEENA